MSQSTKYIDVPQDEPGTVRYRDTNVDTAGVVELNPLQGTSPPSPPEGRRRYNIPSASSMKQPLIIVGVVVGIILLLVVIIVPMSYSTLEYYELGFKRRKSTGLINRDESFGPGGRYLLGPDYSFTALQADAHIETFNGVSIFAKDRLQVSITAHMQYFLRVDQMRLLHKKYDTRYRPILYTNALNALKNKATSYTTREFIRNRTRIEYDLFLAVRDMISGPCCEKNCRELRTCIPGCQTKCLESQYGFYADVRYFQLDRLNIPDDLEDKFLRGLVLTEENETEGFKQEATVVRKKTDADVKKIENEAREISQDATASSELVRSMAKANATSIIEDARSKGLKHLYKELQISDQKEKASFDYLRTLRGQENVHLAVDFQQLIAGRF